jgi:spore coat polysaccharide biosynthesis protein SpsF
VLGIILQARMGSSRLPGKILMNIGHRNLLEHILFRLKYLKHDAKVVIATSTSPKDDRVQDFCKAHDVECFRGSELNVLERYYFCSKKYGFYHIVRLTGDNPFTDIEELDNLIDLHMRTKSDYTHSFGVLPIGVGAEIFTFKALEESYLKGTMDNHREHVNEYIQEHPELFNISVLSVDKKKNRPDIRLTVDTREDLKRARDIVENGAVDFVDTEKAIELCLRFA